LQKRVHNFNSNKTSIEQNTEMASATTSIKTLHQRYFHLPQKILNRERNTSSYTQLLLKILQTLIRATSSTSQMQKKQMVRFCYLKKSIQTPQG